MKIDELVERFLVKDSESNIQLITTAGIDFSIQHSVCADKPIDKKPEQPNRKSLVKAQNPSSKETTAKGK